MARPMASCLGERSPARMLKRGRAMDHATGAWWLSLLRALTTVVTRPGWGRVAPWGTGMVRCWEAPTLPQLLTALGLESRGRVLEPFAESGAWAREAAAWHTRPWLERARLARWGRGPPVAGVIPSGTAPASRAGARG